MSTRQERTAMIAARLDELYPLVEAPLHHKHPFQLLVAVILSAQCTDQRVLEVTPGLFKLAKTPKEMAGKKVAQIERLIRPCGLSNNKAKAIKNLSQILIAQHGGCVPETFSELEALPGVGHKTASVVMAQAFGKPAFPVDTHIHRLAQRWGLTRGHTVVQTEKDLKKLFPSSEWHKRHLQIIFYGREHCTARGCDGTRCELCRTCYPNRKCPVVTVKG